MADDQRKDPHDTKQDMGQMGSQNPQSGQKGGQAEGDMSQKDYSRSDTSGMEEDTGTLGDEEL